MSETVRTSMAEIIQMFLDILNEDYRKIKCETKREYIESLITRITKIQDKNYKLP
jgi:hypothetical protein